jgi:hypothetical protein
MVAVPAFLVDVRTLFGDSSAHQPSKEQPAPPSPTGSPQPAGSGMAAGPPPGGYRQQPDEPLTLTGKLSLTAEVQRKGNVGKWAAEARGIPGDVVTWLLRVRNNNSDRTYENVAVRVILAPHLTVVPGTVRIYDARQDTRQADDPAFQNGFLLGRFGPGGVRYLAFDTRLEADFAGCSTTVRNLGLVDADGLSHAQAHEVSPERQAAADVLIVKEHC